jgi:hypothetical protein
MLGAELIYFVSLLIRCSYTSVLQKVCAGIVEIPSLFALMLPLVQKYCNLSLETEDTILTVLMGLIAMAEFAALIRLISIYVSLLAPCCQEKKTEKSGKLKKKAIR